MSLTRFLSRFSTFVCLSTVLFSLTIAEEDEVNTAIKHDPRVVDALKKRGITDLNLVTCYATPGATLFFPSRTAAAGPVYINPNAFTLPPVNAGRFGTSSVGSVAGPGTDAVSLSLIKSIKITK